MVIPTGGAVDGAHSAQSAEIVMRCGGRLNCAPWPTHNFDQGGNSEPHFIGRHVPAGCAVKRGRSGASRIARRDFLNGMAWAAGSALLPPALAASLDAGPDPSAEEYFLSRGITPADPGYYPPALT